VTLDDVTPSRARVILRDALKALKDELPTRLPVVVEYRALAGDACAYCRIANRRGRRSFVITIEKRYHVRHRLFLLAHEYAHALDWFNHEDPELAYTMHPPSFGLWWARAHHVIFGD